jgi:cytochrome c oxidase subunit 3
VTESDMSVALPHGGMLEDSPFGIESKKLVMWLFIIADAATFGALLFGYGYLRVGSPNWIRPFGFLPTILNGMVMTAVLLTSSLTMLAAVRAAQGGNARRRESVRWLVVTALLGVVFAALHLREWFNLFAEGWSPSTNPMGGSVLFGGTFFGITGLHLLHVLCGVVAILVVAVAFRRGRLNAGHVETTGLYWHFVDLVWMFVFPLVYLMNAR